MSRMSWLREFAPFDGDPVALGHTMCDLGMAVEVSTTSVEGLDGIVVARVLDLRPHPYADKIQLVDVDPGDGEAAADLLRRVQHGRRRPGAAGHVGHDHARRPEDRASQAAGRVVQRHAVLGPRARARRRPRRHHDPRPAGRRRARRSPTPWASYARRALRPRDQPQPARRHVGRRRGPRPRGHARRAVRPPGAARSPAAPRRRGRRSRSSTPSSAAGSTPGCSTASDRAVAGVDRRPADARSACARSTTSSTSSNYVMLELGQPNHTYDLAKLPAARSASAGPATARRS